ncbi:hypothetical protein HN446_01975 [bacterium]|jgi:WD40 repeat protein|nr:hypothetical protein [bacterium]
MKWSPCNDSLLAFAPCVGCVKIFNTDTGDIVSNLSVDEMDEVPGAVKKFCWSPNGEQVAVIFSGGRCFLFNSSSGACISQINLHVDPTSFFSCFNVSFSPDGLMLLISYNDTIEVFNMLTLDSIYSSEGFSADCQEQEKK